MVNGTHDYQEIVRDTFKVVFKLHYLATGLTAEQFSSRIGVSTNTVNNWKSNDGAAADMYGMIKLFSYFGSEFSEPFLNIAGLTGAHKIDDEPASLEKIHTELAYLDYLITKAKEDGKITTHERVDIEQGLTSLCAKAASFSKKREA